jgi:hypothetical protein
MVYTSDKLEKLARKIAMEQSDFESFHSWYILVDEVEGITELIAMYKPKNSPWKGWEVKEATYIL